MYYLSSSSMKMMAGEFFSASSKAFLRLLSDSPAILDMISGPLIRKKKAPVSLATALAIKVLPVPELKDPVKQEFCFLSLSPFVLAQMAFDLVQLVLDV